LETVTEYPLTDHRRRALGDHPGLETAAALEAFRALEHETVPLGQLQET